MPTLEPPGLEDAIILAAQAHRGQQDKAGRPYILHPLAVMLKMQTDEARIAAVLHDVIEDSPTTLDDLRRLGYSERVLTALDHVTRRDGEDYDAFVRRSGEDALARAVKLGDLENNMDTTRLGEITERDRERLARYERAYAYLRGLGGGARPPA
jgi:(p)ppGpp synthase/HD superfamily hydrolase